MSNMKYNDSKYGEGNLNEFYWSNVFSNEVIPPDNIYNKVKERLVVCQ